MIVVIWTAAATVGAAVAAWGAYDAWRDLRALGDSSNGRRILAVGWVRREIIRFAIQAVWAAIGILALPTAGSTVNPIALLLVATNVAVMANTILDVRERLQVRRIIG